MTRLIFSLIVVCLLSFGCQSNSVKRMQAKNPLSKNSAKSPTKMVDVWNTYAQTVPGGKPIRGVAGRVHFYTDAKKKQSVKVDGSMTVFVFDGDQKDPAHAKPLKVFQFKPETLDKHYSFKKPLGHGYDFFLPFDAIDGVEKPLCILARFDDSLEGTLVLSPPVNVMLKGSRSEEPIKDMLAQQPTSPDKTSGKIEQASFQNPAQSKASLKPEAVRNVSTITLNDHLTRRLAQAPPQLEEKTPIVTPPKPIEQVGWTGTATTASDDSFNGLNPNYPSAVYPTTTF